MHKASPRAAIQPTLGELDWEALASPRRSDPIGAVGAEGLRDACPGAYQDGRLLAFLALPNKAPGSFATGLERLWGLEGWPALSDANNCKAAVCCSEAAAVVGFLTRRLRALPEGQQRPRQLSFEFGNNLGLDLR